MIFLALSFGIYLWLGINILVLVYCGVSLAESYSIWREILSFGISMGVYDLLDLFSLGIVYLGFEPLFYL